MDMMKSDQIAGAGPTDWRKLPQGLHALQVHPWPPTRHTEDVAQA